MGRLGARRTIASSVLRGDWLRRRVARLTPNADAELCAGRAGATHPHTKTGCPRARVRPTLGEHGRDFRESRSARASPRCWDCPNTIGPTFASFETSARRRSRLGDRTELARQAGGHQTPTSSRPTRCAPARPRRPTTDRIPRSATARQSPADPTGHAYAAYKRAARRSERASECRGRTGSSPRQNPTADSIARQDSDPKSLGLGVGGHVLGRLG